MKTVPPQVAELLINQLSINFICHIYAYASASTSHTRTHTRTHARTHTRTHTHTHPFNGPFSGTTRVIRYQKGEINVDFTEARDSEWQWHQLGHMQVASRSRQITTPVPHHSSFLQAGCPSCHPTNSVKALKAICKYIKSGKISRHNKMCRTGQRSTELL